MAQPGIPSVDHPVVVDLKKTARKIFGVAFVFSIFINLLLLVSPIYMLQIYDRVLASGSAATLIYLTIAGVGLLAAMGALEHYRSQVMIRMGTHASRVLDQHLFSGTLRSFNRGQHAEATQPVRDLDTISTFLGSPGPTSLMDAPWIPIFLFIIFLMHPVLGIVALVGSLALGVLAVLTELLSRTPLKSAHTHRSRSMQFIDSTMRNAPAIEAMGMGGRLMGQWLDIYRKASSDQSSASERMGLVKGWVKFLRPSLQIAMLGTGAYLALRQEISPGVIVAASIISGRALAPIEQAVGSWKQIIAARDSYGRLKVFLNAFCAPKQDRVALPKPKGHLSVENLVGAPPGVRTVILKKLTFSLQAGEFLGVGGPSGSGKSTLAHMLIGIWQPMSGSVRLDGADVAKWDKDDLGSHIGFVPQDCDMFEGTIAQNIARFGQIDSEAVLEAAELAGVHEFILRLENGYETRVGAGGIWLSAGQRQRIHLARAIYGRPALLVLDEPNTHMDAGGEAALMETLRTLKGQGTTIILICHRRPMLALADRLLVLRDGQIANLGKADEVLQQMSSGSGKQPANDPRAAAASG
ncbi:MAG: type I secretion system permease/ATPase [Alphaproteobacteria bacterium]